MFFSSDSGEQSQGGGLVQKDPTDFDRYFIGLNLIHTSSSAYFPIWKVRWAQETRVAHAPAAHNFSNHFLSILIKKMSALSLDENLSKPINIITNDPPTKNVAAAILFTHRDPLKSITLPMALKLINAWFSNHAFPLILNRTLMIQDYCTNRIDPFLYAAVFGKGLKLDPDPRSWDQGTIFLDYAQALWEREPYFPCLSRLQGLYILGGYMASAGEFRKSLPFIAAALTMAVELRIHEQDSDQFDQILDPVERELRNNIWWALRISMTWGAFQINCALNGKIMNASIKLPVKNENDSALFALDKRYGQLLYETEHIHLIRSFHTCAYLTTITSSIWQRTATSFPCPFNMLGIKVPKESNGAPTQSNFSLGNISDDLNKTIMALPTDLDPVYAAEMLLFLHTLKIHTLFISEGTCSTPILNVDTIPEYSTSADVIVNLSEILLENPESVHLHPIMAFGLNTSASIYSIIAGSRILNMKKEAVANLRKTIGLLSSQKILYHDPIIVQTIERILLYADNEQMELQAQTENTMEMVLVPRVGLGSLTNVERAEEDATQNFTLNVLLIRPLEQSALSWSTEASFPSFFTPEQLQNPSSNPLNDSKIIVSPSLLYSTSSYTAGEEYKVNSEQPYILSANVSNPEQVQAMESLDSSLSVSLASPEQNLAINIEIPTLLSSAIQDAFLNCLTPT
ncbi:uncharacterized protein VTP21DRAFT_6002 [Calcarisporiella thermophila]|uniref:uncharacterized protein n=1 Tax=Calcarisporiella thermophila TaxID=911321 RepID=UPI0037442F5C